MTDTTLKRQGGDQGAYRPRSSPDLTRFQPGARLVLAAEDHPALNHLHDRAQTGPAIALSRVMELVEGADARRSDRARARFRSMRRCRSRGRSPTPSRRRTSAGSSIAI